VSGPPDDRPPDLALPVLGFRLWNVGIQGTLGAIAAGSIWKRGVNEAVCCPAAAPSRRPKHTSPHPGCVCGFNAYSTLHRKLRSYPLTVLGAIAAWGEMDVYRSGFRAQYAQVLALALPGNRKVTDGEKARIELAADRYGVPLVKKSELEAFALQYAAPVPDALKPGRTLPPKPAAAPAASPSPAPRRSARSTDAAAIATWRHARGSAIWLHRHVALRCRSDVIEVCPAPGATALLPPEPQVRARPLGDRVRAGEVLASIDSVYPGEAVHLLSPVDGTVTALNPGFAAALLDGDPAVSAAPWLAGVRPEGTTPLDDAPVLWGRPGAELYRRAVADLSDAEVLAELGPPPAFDHDDLRPLEQAPAAAPALLPLGSHQRRRTATRPTEGRRAAIMVDQLRPLLHAVGVAGPDDLLAA
jgi:hypothetical protein